MSFLAEDDDPRAARPQATAWSQHSQPQRQMWPDEDPAYYEPAYYEPAYAEPGYYQPAYREPSYGPEYYEPDYYEPGYYEPEYREPQYPEPEYRRPRAARRTARTAITRSRVRRPATGIRGTTFPDRPSRTPTSTTWPISGRPRLACAVARIPAGSGTAGAASGPSGWPGSWWRPRPWPALRCWRRRS